MNHRKNKKANWIIGLTIIIVSIALSGTQAFRQWEWTLYRWCTEFAPVQPKSSEIIVVEIDAQSLQALGPQPWPRDLITAATRKIANAKPAVIGYTLSFEHGQNEIALNTLHDYVEQNQQSLEPHAQVINRIRRQLDSDRTLVNTIKRLNTVLAIPYSPSLQPKESATAPAFLKQYHLETVRSDSPTFLLDFFRVEQAVYIETLTPPKQTIAQASRKLGILTAQAVPDSGISAVPLVLPHAEQYLPAFELVVASNSAALKNKTLKINDKILFDQEILRTDHHFRIYPNYQTHEKNSFTFVSFNDVLNDQVPSATFRNKTVLIGDTTTAELDTLPPVLLSAHIISSIIQNDGYRLSKLSYPGRFMTWILITIFLILILPRLSLNTGLSYTLIALIVILLAELLPLALKNTWIPLATPLTALIIGYLLQTVNLFLQKQLNHYQSEISQTNILLGQSYQAQGQLDLAYECYQKCMINKNLLAYIYNLGLDYERKRQFNKAVKVFQYIASHKTNYKDVQQHIEKNQQHDKATVFNQRSNHSNASTLLLTDNEIENPMLGRYQIKKMLGQGAMGTVYLGSDPKISRTVAIKTMAISNDDEKNISDFRKRFYREAETAGRLSHPNIVTIYDVGEEHDLAYIAMDYIKGSPLSDFIKPKKRLPPNEIFEILIQVSDALHYAHQNKVVHRDIKPANIIYNKHSKTCTITDFGVAHITDMNHTNTGTILGTPYYMSPEQLAGKKVDGRADIFAVGITLYQLLSGERPFDGENLSALMYNITNKKHPDILSKMPELPVCVKVIINKCLQKEISKRYQNAAQLMRALQNCLKQL